MDAVGRVRVRFDLRDRLAVQIEHGVPQLLYPLQLVAEAVRQRQLEVQLMVVVDVLGARDRLL